MKPYLMKMLAPIPSILNQKCALFIGPHPDDIEIGAGATVSRLISQGTTVYFAIITDGGSGSFDPQTPIDELIKIRHQEALDSAQYLGVKEVFFLDFPDGGRYDDWDVAIKLTSLIQKTNPDIVFCPDPDLPSEIHPDHPKTGRATKTALLMSSNPLVMARNNITIEPDFTVAFNRSLGFYYTHRANHFVPINKTNILQAQEAILKHNSQFQVNSETWMTLKKYLNYRYHRFGNLIHLKREGFFVMGPVHLHCFPEINEF